MTHDELANDLAAHLRTERRMVWTNMQLGASGSPRPDVYAIFKSFAHPAPMAYEAKVTVADFRSDVTSGKWQSYLAYACGVVFAAPAGLVSRDEIPAHCGLIVRGPVGWRMAKRPVLNPVTIPQDALLKLVIDGVEREGPKYRRLGVGWEEAHRSIEKRLGKDVARFAHDSECARRDLKRAEEQREDILANARQAADQMRKEADLSKERAELAELLELAPTAGRWQIQSALSRLREDRKEHPAARNHRRLTETIRRALENYGFVPEEEQQAIQPFEARAKGEVPA